MSRDFSQIQELANQAAILVSGLLPLGYLSVVIVVDHEKSYLSSVVPMDELVPLFRELLRQIELAEPKESPREH